MVTRVLAGAGTFYAVTGSALTTIAVTTLGVALALTQVKRGHGAGR